MEGNFYCTVSDEITKKRLKRKSERFNIIVSLKLILIFILKKKLILHDSICKNNQTLNFKGKIQSTSAHNFQPYVPLVRTI